MTNESGSKRTAWRRVAPTVLGLLALVAAACSGSTIEASGEVATGDTANLTNDSAANLSDDSGVNNVDDFSVSDVDGAPANGFSETEGSEHLQYGATLDDLLDSSPQAAPVDISLPGFRSIEWEDLIPPGFSSQEVFSRYKDRLDATPAGSAELDALYAEMNAELDAGTVNPALDSKKIQLAGFVAPLTYEGDRVIEFLLVPYFGACIHVPPPPANQTVMVSLAEGQSLSLEESWGAVWVAGEMVASTVDTDLATAGYTISGAQFGVYNNQ